MITNYWCTESRPSLVAKERDEIERHIREFLERGGRIEVVPTTCRSDGEWHRAPLVNAKVDQRHNQKRAAEAKMRRETKEKGESE